MKKIFLIVAVLMLTSPLMAQTIFSAVAETTADACAVVAIYYDATAESERPRAFALDFVVTDGNVLGKEFSISSVPYGEEGAWISVVDEAPGGNIIEVSDFHTGESNKPPGSLGFGIFPASFDRFINADDPNWADVNYTPVAELSDLPADTQPGIGTSGITIEMGSLYVGEANAPPRSGLLCKVKIAAGASDKLYVHANVARALTGVVLEDGNDSPTNLHNPNGAWTHVFPHFLDGDCASPGRGAHAGLPDGVVDSYDQGRLIDHWGPGDMPYSHWADVASAERGAYKGWPDGVVDSYDQGRVIDNWGAPPYP